MDGGGGGHPTYVDAIGINSEIYTIENYAKVIRVTDLFIVIFDAFWLVLLQGGNVSEAPDVRVSSKSFSRSKFAFERNFEF